LKKLFIKVCGSKTASPKKAEEFVKVLDGLLKLEGKLLDSYVLSFYLLVLYLLSIIEKWRKSQRIKGGLGL